MNIIIIGDKYQKGMKSKGCQATIPFQKHTMLEHQYMVLKKFFPFSRITYINGYDNKHLSSFIKTKKLDIRLIDNPLYSSTNNAYSLYLASNLLVQKSIILFGHTILTNKCFDKLKTNNQSKILVNKMNLPHNTGELGCVIQNDKVENISFDLPNPILDIYYLTKDHAEQLKNIIDDSKKHNNFIFEIINILIDSGMHISPFFVSQKYNSIRDLYNAEK